MKSILVLAASETFLVAAAFRAGPDLRLWAAGIESSGVQVSPVQNAVFAAVVLLSMLAFGLYQRETCRDLRQTLFTLMVAFGFSAVLLMAIFFLMPELATWRSIFASGMAVALSLLLIVRLAFTQLVDLKRFRRRIVVLGAGQFAAKIKELEEDGHSVNFACEQYFRMEQEEQDVSQAKPYEEIKSLPKYCQNAGIDEIVTAMDHSRGVSPVEDLMACKQAGVNVIAYTSFMEREEAKVDIDAILPSWFIYSDYNSGGMVRAVLKRSLDVVASLILLLLTFPIMIVAFFAVKLTSRGGALFKQERIGKQGKQFVLFKFRSMKQDAEGDGVPKWAQEVDPRVTRVGRVIRSLRIDELPQIFNVFRGDMSFVGPRPERPYFVETLCRELPYYNERHRVRPGITGWAQVKYPYGASIEDAREKVGYDLYYVRNGSPFLDILILIKTIRVVLFGSGAR